MKYIITVAAMAIASGPAFADGHTQGREKAVTKAAKAIEKNGAAQITRIIGDKGRGNGNEPYSGLPEIPDHDPGILGGNGGDPDTE